MNTIFFPCKRYQGSSSIFFAEKAMGFSENRVLV
ncbi:hypothetical protein BC751_4386 [Cecembia calidifontis]|uniref:Uncharacterized protein n=1 Tax=Cecembia calidifontis TaxID=1187080 RepID=A0A4Q7PG69_9BACT|nr:hypothetical protein BC751_4386 [Cecembia calidifontis]